MRTTGILSEIKDERAYQDTKWGTAFDNANTLNDWAAYIGIYLGNATAMRSPPREQRANMVKVAALAVAALEAFDRNEGFAARHYEYAMPQDASNELKKWLRT